MRLTTKQKQHVQTLEVHGEITPERVLADARKQSSPLHSLFEWDVKKAAHTHWLQISRDIIRSVRVEITTESTEVTAVRYVVDPAPPAGRYRDMETLSESERLVSVVAEVNRAAGHMKRAASIAAMAGLTGLDDLVLAWLAWANEMNVEMDEPLLTAAD